MSRHPEVCRYCATVLANSKKMLELLQRFISENMLSVYGQELAEDLVERILE